MTVDFSHLFKKKKFESLDELTPEEREQGIYDALMEVEVQIVDLELANWYQQAKQTQDWADRMRYDIAYWDRIAIFRQNGQMTSVEKLKEKAKSLCHITEPQELWKVLVEHQRAFAESCSVK